MTTATAVATKRCATISRGPRRPAARGLGLRANLRVVDPRAEARQQRREQGEHDGDADQRDQHAADAHAAQERHRHDDQRHQADRDRDAGRERRHARRSSSR